MTVSLEAVPRNPQALLDYAAAAADFPAIRIINVPDLARFPLRSWEACDILADNAPGRGFSLMPHIRAIDFDLSEPFPLAAHFRAAGISRVLVIAGDPPKDKSRKTYPTGTADFIKKLKIEMPEMEVYAAFDPYRSNIRYELDYVRAKEEAGASGFMSQPFFDLRLLEIYAEFLEGKTVFWGVSPVLSEGNRNYWESRNRAIFPKGFRCDPAWNAAFGRRVLDFCRNSGFHLYLMPINIDLHTYLDSLFS